ncbi:MAG: bifunctional aspartate kinase/homoserine dehydrogenase I, partial [Thermoanaerobaculia bacterium]
VEHVRAAAPGAVVVVSAMQGVTDLLLGAARAAAGGETKGAADAADEFEQRHRALVADLVASKRAAKSLGETIARAAGDVRSMAAGVAVLGELTPRASDMIAARGELVLAAIFAELLASRRIPTTLVDPQRVLFTERRYGTFWPDFSRCDRAAKKIIVPLLDEGSVVVVPGFLGSGPDGELVTLGRGGSDFSAAILARSVAASSVTLFKEVDGLMTADPKSVAEARVIPELHYREAAELAYYGAKVLHPRTMIPLADRRIPLILRNTFRDDAIGTRIAADVAAGDYPVRALTAIRRQSLLSIEGKGMIGVPGIAARTFAALAAAGHSVSMISQSSSEASICFVVPEEESKHAAAALESAFELERKLKLIDRIRAERGMALIAVVGLGMQKRRGVAARVFSALAAAKINIVAIAQGSSELNITVAIEESSADAALRALHREFQLDRVRPLADVTGREAKLTLLGLGRIGRALAKQLASQTPHLRDDLAIDLRIIAAADRSGIQVEEKGFSPGTLQKLARRKAAGARLFDRTSPLSVREIVEMLRREVWLLPSYRAILVDLTSEETAPLLQEALEQRFHVVLANKKPLSVPQIEFDRLFDTARESGVSIRYEATVGAGLPVFDTLAKLRSAGDRIDSILGCLSGTIGYLMTAIEEGTRFSEAVRKAWTLGYTEPDPRDDLSGTDVARKALILARTLGRRLDLQEIELEPLFRPENDDPDPERFIAGLAALDDEFARRAELAKKKGQVLRYVARIGKGSIRVGIEAVPASSPLGRLRGTDNQIAIQSKRYKTNPLILTGPGAGPEVTAAGVLNDIVAITTEERVAR